jgi:undecaprenyl-diphosphatase
MSFWESIILGIVQGLTEFLPVSSSGHIELGKAIFDINENEAGLLFTVTLHFATALSTIIVFRKDILELIKGIFKFRWNSETKFVFFIVLSIIPAAFVGLFFKDYIDGFFSGNIILVSFMLILTGILLFLSDKLSRKDGLVNTKNALLLGAVQAIAILPGISRSGSTIAVAVLLGINRERAARFSFLMVLPLIFGAMAKEIMDFSSIESNVSSSSIDMTIIAGFLAALVSGIFACKWMIAIVKRSRLVYFAYYCWLVGLIGLIYQFI